MYLIEEAVLVIGGQEGGMEVTRGYSEKSQLFRQEGGLSWTNGMKSREERVEKGNLAYLRGTSCYHLRGV